MRQANLLVLDFSPISGLGNQVADVLASCRNPGLQIRYESVSQDEINKGAGERVSAVVSYSN
ncbi:MAG: hypothetical protein ACREAB_05545, partial [Blastocatellia bacterium]